MAHEDRQDHEPRIRHDASASGRSFGTASAAKNLVPGLELDFRSEPRPLTPFESTRLQGAGPDTVCEIMIALGSELAQRNYTKCRGELVPRAIFGLFCPGIAGFPGTYAQRICDTATMQNIARLAGQSGDSTAYAVCVVTAYRGNGEPESRIACIKGSLVVEPIRTDGDPWQHFFVASQVLGHESTHSGISCIDVSDGLVSDDPRALIVADLALRPFRPPLFYPILMGPNDELCRQLCHRMATPLLADQIEQTTRIVVEWMQKYIEYVKRFASDDRHRNLLIQRGEYAEPLPDQLLDQTPAPLDPTLSTSAMVQRHFDLMLLTDPACLEAWLEIQKNGYCPMPRKEIPVLSAALDKGRAHSFDELRLQAKGVASTNLSHVDIGRCMAGSLYGWVVKGEPSALVCGNSGVDVSGAWSLATLGIIGAMGFVPSVNRWRDPNAQLQMLQRAKALIEIDPSIVRHECANYVLTNGQTVSQFIRARAIRCLGVSLPADPEHALRVVEFMAERSDCNLFKIWDPNLSGNCFEAALAVRQRFGSKVRILAGPVRSLSEAKLLTDSTFGAEVDGIIVGGPTDSPTGEGEVDDLVDNAAVLAYSIINEGLSVPILFGGGVGKHNGVAIGLGGGRMMSLGLIGGTIESPPLFWSTKSGKFTKIYPIGSSNPRLITGDSDDPLDLHVDRLGRPRGGRSGRPFQMFDSESPSIATRFVRLWEATARTVRSQGHTSAIELQNDRTPEIVRVSVSRAAD